MIDKKTIDRINFLANKSKNEGLTKKEQEEQSFLRKEYLKQFRTQFKKQLDNIELVD